MNTKYITEEQTKTGMKKKPLPHTFTKIYSLHALQDIVESLLQNFIISPKSLWKKLRDGTKNETLCITYCINYVGMFRINK